jgi:hypothetical protein
LVSVRRSSRPWRGAVVLAIMNAHERRYEGHKSSRPACRRRWMPVDKLNEAKDWNRCCEERVAKIEKCSNGVIAALQSRAPRGTGQHSRGAADKFTRYSTQMRSHCRSQQFQALDWEVERVCFAPLLCCSRCLGGWSPKSKLTLPSCSRSHSPKATKSRAAVHR